ncbi:hypothetical protein DFJ73DRAFT_588241 [Zopfochytrium polystomum]|nr:hypothetical protein DFJ73DRAFT_588241 [Zopfochytrium polystomum]
MGIMRTITDSHNRFRFVLCLLLLTSQFHLTTSSSPLLPITQSLWARFRGLSEAGLLWKGFRVKKAERMKFDNLHNLSSLGNQ